MSNKQNPKGSHIYRKMNVREYTTPLESNLFSPSVGYKHIIPPGLETEIKNNLKGLRYE